MRERAIPGAARKNESLKYEVDLESLAEDVTDRWIQRQMRYKTFEAETGIKHYTMKRFFNEGLPISADTFVTLVHWLGADAAEYTREK